jgi:hypothetical protein
MNPSCAFLVLGIRGFSEVQSGHRARDFAQSVLAKIKTNHDFKIFEYQDNSG